MVPSSKRNIWHLFSNILVRKGEIFTKLSELLIPRYWDLFLCKIYTLPFSPNRATKVGYLWTSSVKKTQIWMWLVFTQAWCWSKCRKVSWNVLFVKYVFSKINVFIFLVLFFTKDDKHIQTIIKGKSI